MSDLPTGTVTFLFTDLEGSTRLWEEHPQAMRAALARHDKILRDSVEKHDGHVVKTTGDGIHAAFATAHDAVAAAVEAQEALASEEWTLPVPLRVRMGAHSGETEYRDGDYYGTAPNRAARLMSVAHGGQVIVSLATGELIHDTLPDGVTLVDLGEHRLRDLSRPERVFQVGVGEFPPLRSLDAFPGNLPAQITSFIGRDADLADIAAAFDECRVLTLTGVGGVGKTRLALQVAAEHLPRYPDGAWLVELGPIGDADAVVEVVAAALGIQQHQGRSLGESVIEALRTKQLLIVLDNCEHLLDAAADLVDEVVRSCPGVQVLATSREALDVPGERAKRLRSLPLPGASASTDDLALNEAVRLFVERAQEVRSGFALDDATAPAVVQICRRLDGIPLALELAAARVASMQPADISARLDERFRLLTGGRRTAVERHHTLRAAVDWSYDLLDDRERTVFDRLAVFAGGFTLDAAEHVVAGDGIDARDVLDLLEGLVARSMVALDESTAETRYELLETMRQYARERLEAGTDPDDRRALHGRYFLDFARRAAAGLLGPDEEAWVRRAEADLDNLRAAFTWAADRGDLDVALGIPAAFWWEAFNRLSWGVGRWAQDAVTRPGVDDHPAGRRALGVALGWLNTVGELDAADACWERVLEINRRSDLAPEPVACFARASELTHTGRIDNAIRLAGEALEGATSAGDELLALAVRSQLALFQWIAGDRSAAGLAEENLRVARTIGGPSVIAFALYSVGYTLQLDDPGRAIECFREGIEQFRRMAFASMVEFCLMLLIRLEALQGDLGAALESFRSGLELSYEQGSRVNVIFQLKQGALALTRAGHTDVAAVLLGYVDAQPQRGTAGWEGEFHEGLIAEARVALGTAEYDAAAARGAAMPYDEIVQYALTELDRVQGEQTDS